MKKLYEMPNTVVHVRTKEEYDEYAKMCEDVGWEWIDGKSPLYKKMFYVYEENTAITIKDGFQFGNKEYGRYNITLTLKQLKERLNMFTKDDLRTGMVVEIRNGYKYVIMLNSKLGDIFIMKSGAFMYVADYTNNLKYQDNSEYDIMKVFGSSLHNLLEITVENLLWERNETRKVNMKEVCEQFGEEVEITKE